jgi:ATP-binding cassette, subfamily B, bacterial PglK
LIYTTIRRLLVLLSPSQKRGLRLVGLLTATAAPLEMLGLGLLLPLLQVALTPEKISDLPVLSEFSDVPHHLLLLGFAVAFLLFFAIKNTLLGFIVIHQNHYAKRVEAELRVTMLETYLTRDYAEHLQQNSAEMLRTIMRSVSSVVSGLVVSALALVLESVLAASALAVLLYVEPVGTLAAIGLLGAGFGGFYFALRHRIQEWGRVSEGMTASMYQWINQSLGAIRETSILGRGQFFIGKFSESAHRLGRYQAWANSVQQFPRLAGEIIVLGAVLVVVMIAMWRSSNAMDAMPVVGLFVAAAFRVLPSLNRILSAAAKIREHAPALENVLADFRGFPAQDRPSATPMRFERGLAFDNVDYAYPNTSELVLKGVSAVLKKGESMALVGPSGAGKSTLADIVLGLLTPTAGCISADGEDIQENIRGWQSGLGFVPQTVFLSDDSLRRNIAFGIADSDIDEDRVREAAAMAQLDDVITGLPEGLDTEVGERGARLSGGQRQRIGIARALYSDPDLLVLDEATSALDSETENRITRLISGFRGKKTLLIIAHRLSTVRHCDRLVFLSNGRVEGCGTFEELQQTCPGFKRMVQSGDISAAAAGETVE